MRESPSRDGPLYELDMEDLRKKLNAVFPYTVFSLAQYNLGLIADSVPTKVFRDCGLDFDRWYPLPRRLLGTARFMLTHRREREHQRRSLDTVRERFDVRCGPLSHPARSEAGVVPATMGTEHWVPVFFRIELCSPAWSTA